MRLPVKLEYAFQVMAQLAATQGSGNVRRIEDLAQAESISANYLVQILNELRLAGLVESRRGKNGGYLLARSPKDLTLAEIAQAIEGPRLLEASPGTGGDSALPVLELWQRADEHLRLFLDGTTLDSLIPASTTDWMI